MKIGAKDIFPSAYEGKGVCSWDTKNIHHANNLWMSTVSVHEDGKDKTLFCGIRHGVLSPIMKKIRFCVTSALKTKPKKY